VDETTGGMVDLEDIIEPEWLDWYRKTPEERFLESQKLMAHYLAMGGSLAPDIDHESPFWCEEDLEGFAKEMKQARQNAGVKLIRRDV